MLDRERADFFRVLEQLKAPSASTSWRPRSRSAPSTRSRGVIDLVDMRASADAGEVATTATEIEIPEEPQARPQEYREKLMDEVCGVSDALMERYLEGERDLPRGDRRARSRRGPTTARCSRSCAASRRATSAPTRLLDAIVEDLPSPVKHGGLEVGEVVLEPLEDKELFAYVFKTRADPFAGRINLFRVYQGVMQARHPGAQHARPHQGADRAAREFEGSQTGHSTEFGPGDIGAVAKLKETQAPETGSTARDEPLEMPSIKLPAPVMAFAVEPKSKGDEEKVFTALRRLQEEDPTIDLHRDAQTGEQIVAGLSQVHVEVIVERLQASASASR